MASSFTACFCPYAERSRLILAAKNIPYQIINIDLKSKPDWFLKRNPLGKVPTLEEPGNKITYESLIVSEYIDDVFDGPKLLPSDPYGRARQKMLVEIISQLFLDKLIKLHLVGEEHMKATLGGLEKVENLLEKDFFSGDQVGFVDLMICPWFLRFPVFEALRGFNPSAERYPKIFAWTARMKELAFIKENTYPTDLVTKFAKSYVEGHPEYDAGL